MSILRPIAEPDFDAMFDMASDYAVVQGTGTWPWPAQPQFTRRRFSTPEVLAGKVLAIQVDGAFAGTIGLVKGELGYMLARKYWGRGLASRAVAEIVGQGFRQETYAQIDASVWADNPASARVLLKNGFEHVRSDMDYGAARGVIGPIDRFRLSRARWAATAPVEIMTARLHMQPIQRSDAAELSELMNDRAVSKMMSSIAFPFTKTKAEQWISSRLWDGTPNLAVAVRLHTGGLVGVVGIGGTPLTFGFGIGAPHRGLGFATEACAAFLDEMTARFEIDAVNAGAYADNHASHRVLTKLGFEKTGEIMDKSPARLEPSLWFEYRRLAAQHRGKGGDRNEIS